MKQFLQRFHAFYPSYLEAHANWGNQVLHFIGASLFFLLIALAFVFALYWLIVLAILMGYLLPGIGHRFFEHNDSFRTSKPLLCVACAFRMYIDTLTFRLAKK